MEAKLPLEAVTLVLSELRGYFVFSTRHGDYVVMPKERFDEMKISATEQQLELPRTEDTAADDNIEQVNRDIALEKNTEDLKEEVDDLALPLVAKDGPPIDLPHKGKRVRFEPLRGDLPPELQE